jgi:hypothetical protein
MKNNLLSLKNLIWFCAIGLATFSGYYSVFGIAKLFSGGSWSIVGMAAMLEFSKLVVITFLHDHFSSLKTSFKLYLTSAASVLMIITSIGVYGYLTNSYQETAKHIYQTQNRLELLTKKQQLFSDQKNKLDTLLKQKTQRITSYDNLRLSQENVLNNQLNQKGSTRGLQKNIQSVDKATETLNIEISQLSAKSLALTDSVTIIEQEKLTLSNSTFTSELGPLLYLSRITGLSMDLVVNWFILILVIVFDPLAVSLVIAANHLKNKEKDENTTSINGNSIENKTKTIVDNQITDAVTLSHDDYKVESHEPISDINSIQNAINEVNNPKIKSKPKKEKKNLEISEKSGILEESNEKDTQTQTVEEIHQNVENLYGDPLHPKFEYRRGIKI